MVLKVSRCRNIHRFSLDQSKFSLFTRSDPTMFLTPLWGSFQGLWIRSSSRPRSYACLSAATRNCGNVSEDISVKLKEEASEDGRVLGGSKGPSSHLGPDKRTWQISKWSPMYYISVRTPSAFPPTLHFHLWHGHIDLKERRGARREGGVVSVSGGHNVSHSVLKVRRLMQRGDHWLLCATQKLFFIN